MTKGDKMHPGTIGKEVYSRSVPFTKIIICPPGKEKGQVHPATRIQDRTRGRTGGLSQAAEVQNQAAYAAFHYRFPAAWPVSVL